MVPVLDQNGKETMVPQECKDFIAQAKFAGSGILSLILFSIFPAIYLLFLSPYLSIYCIALSAYFCWSQNINPFKWNKESSLVRNSFSILLAILVMTIPLNFIILYKKNK